MSKVRRATLMRIAASAAIVVGAGAIIGGGTFSAFSSTTQNAGNSFAAGTVAIGDNDAGAALYSVSNQTPGVSLERCIKVTYTGSLAANVRLYTPSSIGALGPYVNLTITPGSQVPSTFPDCTGFTADAGGAIFTGTLAGFATSHSSYSNGLVDYPGAGSAWATSDAVVYRYAVSLADDNAANGGASALTTGAHAFTWESRNQ